MDSGFQILDSSLCQWTWDLWIPIFSGTPDSKAQDSVLHKANLLGFRILQEKKFLEGAHVQPNDPLAAGHLTKLSEIIKQLI